VIHALLDALEADWHEAVSGPVHEQIASVGAYAVIAFCGSF